jgi:uncharacterized protein
LEKTDLKLIEKHAKENNELDRLYKEHVRLEKEIAPLQDLKIKSPEDSKKLKDLKRLKLVGRDRMEEIFQDLR